MSTTAFTKEQGSTLPALYTVPEVAELLRVSVGTVYNFVKRGDLKSIRVGASRRITARAIAEFLAESQ